MVDSALLSLGSLTLEEVNCHVMRAFRQPCGEVLGQGLCGYQPCNHNQPPNQLGLGNSDLGGGQIIHLAQLLHFLEKMEPKLSSGLRGTLIGVEDCHKILKIYALK